MGSELEVVTSGLGGVGPAAGLQPGEWVGLHWGWVCDRLTTASWRACSG